ncbi:hypothetical protein [Chitinimonas sp.]|uniref:hypothetical protein n=1 Tax=Chitinimonas sp. TaxID=1934313 RepID=UPI0035AE1D29
MPALPALQHSLSSGQTRQFQVRCGDLLLVQQGRLQLSEAPSWLADTVFQPPQRLLAGTTHVLVASGWITICADSDVQLRLIRQPAPNDTPGGKRLLALKQRLLCQLQQLLA